MSNPALCTNRLKSGLLAVLALLVVALPASAVNIFVTGLNDSVSSEGLAEAFSQFGEISSAKVVTDTRTGKSRGFGFVEMQDLEGRAAILALNQSELNGRTITVKEADRSDRDRSAPAGFGGGNSLGDPAPSANLAAAPPAPTPPPPVPTSEREDAQGDTETQWIEDTLDPASDTIAGEEEEESDGGGADDEAAHDDTGDSDGDNLSEDALEPETPPKNK